jgi:hypothetical protein
MARLVVITRVGVSGENVLQDPLGQLIPEVRFSCGHLADVGPFFVGPTMRTEAVLGGLLAPFADALRKFDDLATLHGAIATVGMYRA